MSEHTAPSFREQTLAQIDRAMDAADMTQRDLAGRLGVSEARVSQMLANNSNLRLNSVDRILTAIKGFRP